MFTKSYHKQVFSLSGRKFAGCVIALISLKLLWPVPIQLKWNIAQIDRVTSEIGDLYLNPPRRGSPKKTTDAGARFCVPNIN